MKRPFAQIDAFADRPFTGNQAGVMPLDAWLDDAVLQAIAEENNVAETAFIVPIEGDEADYELRWFTPAVEVALCGHATLASGHYVLGEDPTLDCVRFRTRKAGVLEVSRFGDSYLMALPAYPPALQPLPGALKALGVDSAVATLRHPNGYQLIVLESAAQVLALTPDFAALAALGDTLNIVTAPGVDTDVMSRVFAPAAGIDEDPVTGSAHCVLTPYWPSALAATASPRTSRAGAAALSAANWMGIA